MLRKRSPLNEENRNMTFGMGVPADIAEQEMPYHPQNRLLPSQFSFLTMPMNCTVIRNPEVVDRQNIHD